MTYPNKQLQYVEFASRDLGAIKDFYTKAFGWEFTDYGPEYTAYEGEHVHAGFYPGEPMRGSIVPIVYAEDLEMSLREVQAAGGEIVQETFSFPGGRRFHFTDPDGNELAVWSDKGVA